MSAVPASVTLCKSVRLNPGHDRRHGLPRLAGRLARALASVINLLDPDVIVLGAGGP